LPTFITGATSSDDAIKFVYLSPKWFSPDEQGTIKCDVMPDGTLNNCRKMSIKVDGKNYQEK